MRQSVSIELDRPRNIRFDFNAIAAIEDTTGKSIMELFGSEDIKLSLVRTILWAGLRHEDRNLTQEKTGTLIQSFIENDGDLPKLMQAILKAFDCSGLVSKRGNEGNGSRESATNPTPEA